MDMMEAIEWAKGVKVAGDPLKLSNPLNPTVTSDSFKVDIEPTDAQILEFEPGKSMRLKEGEPKIELLEEDGKYRPLVTPEKDGGVGAEPQTPKE